MEAGGDKLHIVVFPWLAFGHLLPFLELSKSLARRGHLISFISTPKNIQRLPNLPSEICHLINFIPFSLPRVEGMADSVEATTDLPHEDIPYLKKALNGLEQPFRTFIEEASPKPDWIIQDFAQHWIPQIAADAGVSVIFFASTPATVLSFLGHPSEWSTRELNSWLVSPPWIPFPSKVAYRLHEMIAMAAGQQKSLPSEVPETKRMEIVFDGCDVLAIRTCRELEPECLPLLEKIYKKPVIPVGLLPPQQASDSRSDTNINSISEPDIMDWLGKHPTGSVVYVALGSEVTISIELLHELALGLELAGLPFLWALRRPFGSSDDIKILPEGFEERTGEYGKVVMGWVPQLKVLANASVGGFLTHCGWGSIVESLQFGHPLVMLPVFGDQGLNARMLEEKGIGIEVEKKDDGSFTKNEVAKALKVIMVQEEGDSYRKKAQEMKIVFADKKCQEKYVDEFVQYLLNHRPSQD